MYGRRRVGKTTLLDYFINDKRAIFFNAQESNDAINLKMFTQQVYQFFEISKTMGDFNSWKDAFSYIAEQAQNQHFILVIDEYPYAAQANKGLNSIIQNCIDHEMKDKTKLFLILCGSQISFMENEVLGYKSPLFGRRTAQMKIERFDYYDSSKLLTKYSNEDKVKFYSCIGGTPHYLSQIDSSASFEENILELYFNVSGYLYDEPQMLLQQELREPAIYNSIITAIAGGATRLNEISMKTELDSKKVNKYINTLIGLKILHRTYPFGDSPSKSRKAIYCVSDNCYRFWFRYVFSFRGVIERGTGRALANQRVFPDLSNFIGKPAFEEICIQYLVRLNLQNRLPFLATDFGSWWGNDNREHRQADFDIIAHSQPKEDILLGECKWRNDLKDVKQIQKLMEKSYLMPGYQNYYFYFFSKTPYSQEALRMEKENSNLTLIDLEDLFSL